MYEENQKLKTWITPDLATEYLAGAVLLGAAPCTAMVFVWSTLTKGNPAYTVVQVASNDIIILFAFVPIVKFLLGVSNVSVPFQTLFMSVVLFVVIPLAAGIITRLLVVRKKGTEYFEQTFLHKFDSATTVGLLLTLILIFMFQGEESSFFITNIVLDTNIIKNGNIIVLKYQSIFRLLIITINNADTIGTITFSLLIFNSIRITSVF